MDIEIVLHGQRLDISSEVMIAVDGQARESAQLCLDHGWDPAGELYDLASMPGHLQELEEKLGRKATRDERRALELAMRQLFAEAASSTNEAYYR